MEDYQRIVEEHAKSQDILEFELGNTLDVKMSIAVVAITFLATQSAGLLGHQPRLPLGLHIAQLLSILFLSIGGVLALVELWPRNYAARMAPSEFKSWVDKLSQFYGSDPNAGTKIIEKVSTQEIERSVNRFNHNSAINALKSKLLGWCFRLIVFALVLNLVTVGGLALIH